MRCLSEGDQRLQGTELELQNQLPLQIWQWKLVVNNLVRWDRWGFHLITGQQTDRLVDLERMLHLFSGKPIPDNRENITIRLDGHIQSVQGKERYEDEMFIIKYFKKGSAHITFKRLELIDRINDIIARYFPSVLSAWSRVWFPFDIKRDCGYNWGYIF